MAGTTKMFGACVHAHLANSPQLPEGGQDVGREVLRGRLQFSRWVAPKAQKDNVAMNMERRGVESH